MFVPHGTHKIGHVIVTSDSLYFYDIDWENMREASNKTALTLLRIFEMYYVP